MSSASNTPPEDYFNDLSRPTGTANGRNNNRSKSPVNGTNGEAGSGGDHDTVPKPKRIACIICRKRKLKCDGTKPSCSTCTRLGHSCAYDEVRRKSGPKRGYVKALEERLSEQSLVASWWKWITIDHKLTLYLYVEQVETLLKTQDPVPSPKDNLVNAFGGMNGAASRSIPAGDFAVNTPPLVSVNPERWGLNGDSPIQPPMEDINFTADMNMSMGIDDSTFTWEMIGLGLEEPLPPQETIDELAPSQRPPVALRYIMWALAASVVEKFFDLKDHFYQRSRKYVESDSLKGHGEHMISVANAQTHVLLASYEFKMMYFPRAWISTGTAIRLCQMMSLHKMDGAGLDVKQCLPPPRDWTEREERRRTFWMAFCEDRYASIGTGWPMTIDEKDILSDLPSSDEAFDMSKAETTQSLAQAMDPNGASNLSPFAGIVLMACLFGRNLIHLHRPDDDDRDHDLNGEFWKRHRNMDNILLNTSLSLPSNLKLPNGLNNPNIVFTNMNIHTSTICLHQAAIYKADKNRLPSSISAESKIRCINAANEIASVMRMVSHMDLSTMNPFISFCLYVAARVFVQYLKSRPEDSQIGDSLRFLLSAMNALKRKNPLTESFLVQLDVDLEGLGMRNPKYKTVFAYGEDNAGMAGCKPKPGAGFNGLPQQPRNECTYMRLPEEIQEEAPTVAGPVASSSNNQNSSEGWDSTYGTGTDQGSNVQSALGNLAIHTTPALFDTFNKLNNVNGGSSYNGGDSGLSPDTANSSSNRPTPSSTTPSDSRPNLQSNRAKSANGSHETSPLPHPSSDPNRHTPMNHFFPGQADFSNISGTGMTPENTYNVPETPGRQFDVPGWENISHNQTTGLTPVGEGVFRQLMGLGPMDPMDIGWEGQS
ncbi:Zn2/Cys6 DNA-binding protein [Glarea lozoyensis ATCC 20868]|uniref:Zn2/Cys6 DNA-binding protein n=1 Tax=Glarea lozoyensis (strain ATCC 20868 / MF5171) TaxID=1116229 RepID=S3CZ56_GLAL2|nr:Zn2/Cys6 DNA-binding protein [Glarea lozoyensis ATCC 20868]EPE31562.1 Zn2/Cys6 DNA-binding protein [Glarea lozoyensis ATCC 20868]